MDGWCNNIIVCTASNYNSFNSSEKESMIGLIRFVSYRINLFNLAILHISLSQKEVVNSALFHLSIIPKKSSIILTVSIEICLPRYKDSITDGVPKVKFKTSHSKFWLNFSFW